MNRKSLNSAIYALSLARLALEDYEAAANLSRQRKAWWEFLLASAAIYEKLKRGAKDSGGATQGWWGRAVRERKDDELLSYIHHARDCAYHGIDEVAESVGGAMQIGPVFITHSPEEDRPSSQETDLAANTNQTYYLDGEQMTPQQAQASGFFAGHHSRLMLVPVTDDRFKDTFYPPKFHLGKAINGMDPFVVGMAAIAHHSLLLTDCQKYLK